MARQAKTYGLGKTKKEYVLGRLNRKRSLKIQFPDSEKDAKGRNIWFLKNNELTRRDS